MLAEIKISQALDWTPDDVISWLKRSLSFQINPSLSVADNLDGCQILTLPEAEIASILSVGKVTRRSTFML